MSDAPKLMSAYDLETARTLRAKYGNEWPATYWAVLDGLLNHIDALSAPPPASPEVVLKIIERCRKKQVGKCCDGCNCVALAEVESELRAMGGKA